MTAKEMFDKMLQENDEATSTEMMIEFAKMHVSQLKEELLKTVDECQANGLKMDVKMLESIININFINQWTQLEN